MACAGQEQKTSKKLFASSFAFGFASCQNGSRRHGPRVAHRESCFRRKFSRILDLRQRLGPLQKVGTPVAWPPSYHLWNCKLCIFCDWPSCRLPRCD